jgi:hypothetical protein
VLNPQVKAISNAKGEIDKFVGDAKTPAEPQPLHYNAARREVQGGGKRLVNAAIAPHSDSISYCGFADAFGILHVASGAGGSLSMCFRKSAKVQIC